MGLTALIVVQWVLVGGLPLTNTRRLWSEPGSLITSSTVVAAVLALFRPTEPGSAPSIDGCICMALVDRACDVEGHSVELAFSCETSA
jgi:hypothetical protein